MVFSGFCVDCDRLADHVNGQIMAPHLVSNRPQQVQAIGMMRNDCQNLPVEPFGFVQLPGLMASNRISEHLLNARRHSLHHRSAQLPFRPALFAVHVGPDIPPIDRSSVCSNGIVT